jgi:hypothetical protein
MLSTAGASSAASIASGKNSRSRSTAGGIVGGAGTMGVEAPEVGEFAAGWPAEGGDDAGVAAAVDASGEADVDVVVAGVGVATVVDAAALEVAATGAAATGAAEAELAAAGVAVV